jgi:hypothetical protein
MQLKERNQHLFRNWERLSIENEREIHGKHFLPVRGQSIFSELYIASWQSINLFAYQFVLGDLSLQGIQDRFMLLIPQIEKIADASGSIISRLTFQDWAGGK